MRIVNLIALSAMVVLGGCFDSSDSADPVAETGPDAQPPTPPENERPPDDEPPSPSPKPDTPPTLDAGAPGCPDDGARAVEVTQPDQLIGGSRVARGQLGDFLIENDRIRALIRQPGRQHHGTVNPYGGTIVDADICRDKGVRERSNFENSALGINIETIPHYTDVTILNDGRNGEAAVIRATGPVDLFEYANPSSVIRDMGLKFPDHADDRPLPVEVQTDYILEPGANYVREETTIFNLSDERQDIYLVEYLSGSGFVDAFIPGTGFGEPLATTSCPATKHVPCDDGMCDPCNFLAFAGYDDARGVSYGRIHPYQGSSSMNITGINILAYGADILPVVLGLDSPNFSIPGDGTLEVERYFAVTGGSVAELQKVRNELFGFEVGKVEGEVTDEQGDPVDGAKVAVIRENKDLELFAVDDPDLKALISGIRPDRVLSTGSSVLGNLLDGRLPDGTIGTALAPELDVVAQSVTDNQGRYDIELSPGDYQVLVFRENHGEPAPEKAHVTIGKGVERTRDFSLPGPGRLELQVSDENGQPIPAKVQLVGYPAHKPLANHQNIFGQLEAQAGVFFDQFVRDPLPDGIAFVDFVGADGRLEAAQVPEGEYELVVSHGPRYSVNRQRIHIERNQTHSASAQLAQVVDTPGFVMADFHVHGIDSLDARIAREDRVLAYLAQGMDFFTPSDHGFQVDFTGVIERLGVGDRIATAPSAEATTMDYGHYNAWPRTIIDGELSGGYMDWGWGDDVAPGERFPALGHYLKSPGGIFEQAKDDPGYRPIVQINHVDSFFRDVGLGVDTGVEPARSTVDPLSRRLDPDEGNLFSDNFDALELWIGESGTEAIGDEEGTIHENLADWFNLINQGVVRTGVASSDSHTSRLTALSTRSLVASGVTDAARLGRHAQTLADNVADGRVVMTNAPFVRIQARNPDTGETASLAHDNTNEVYAPDGHVELEVRVESPVWAEFDRIDLFVNNAPEQTSDEPARYRACEDRRISLDDSDIDRVEVVPGVDGAERLEAEVSVTLDELAEDTWIVARVAGTPGVSQPLFPVDPAGLDVPEDGELEDLVEDNTGQGGVMAYAITNPLFVDTDGGGWEPTGVRTDGQCTEEG